MNQQKPRATLRTVAQHLGISVTTVSRALKDGPEVNQETIDRVKRAADKLGYRPNTGGVNLRTGRSQSIAMVLSFERQEQLNIVTASLLVGISTAMKARGYRTGIVPHLQHDDPLDIVRNLAREGSVDGVIITHTRPQDERVKYLLEIGMPFVTFGRTELLSAHPYVDLDHEQIGADAARLLLDNGHPNPLLFAPSSQFSYSLQFVKGWTKTFNARNLTVPDELIHFSATTPQSGVDMAREVLLRHPESTGAFVASDEAGLGFITAMQQAGRQIGKDFGLITYGGARLHDFLSPPTSAFYYPHAGIADLLSEMLARAVDGEDYAQLRRVVPGEFVDHGSHILKP
ncbi:substrate-binding domain-containing protein (plasmid) [Rhizobium leguminosarum]|uniref:substrate-binding domain-containing protein n=1 Tax=Rhizobium leguminosarum TaxID=384 RepID=UPI001A919990|nr:substrate-binding domain-containing protein [Rhizobium leguminosarum]MBY5558421.1 LacI family transcriptional regulator [Rhizobium leguminosarum]QSW26908.1 substrate-binding domain-containing protein [Rhizobium leguminosarum]